MKKEKMYKTKAHKGQLLKRSLEFLKLHWFKALTAIFSAVAVVFVEMIPPLLLAWLIDDILPSQNAALAVQFLIIYVIVAGLNSGLSILRGYFTHSLGALITYDIRNAAHDHIQRLPVRYFENERTGDIMSRAVDDVEQFEDMITHGARDFLISIMTIIVIAAFMFWKSWQLALIALVPIPILAWIIPRFSSQVRRRYKRVREATGEISALLHDGIAGIRVTRAFVQEDTERDKFESQSRECMTAQVEAVKSWTFYVPLVEWIMAGGVALVMTAGAFLTFSGRLSTGLLAAFFIYMMRFYEPLRRLNMNNNLIQRGLASAERVFELLDEPREKSDAANPVKIGRAKGRICFENVSFAYGENLPALKNVNLDIAPGEAVAIVGHTGAGKSTLLSLIPRFYAPTSGQVTIDGIPTGQIDLQSLREQIGIVFQEAFLFNGTIRDNIAYGKRDCREEELIRAADAAHALNFIRDLPQGFDTVVGERGVKLSGGERQRITIARTLLKDPPILILDEATSAVDAESEELIQDALETLVKGRTTLIVAHRLSTIRNADRAVVVEDGRIVETGTHDSLFSGDTLYRQLYARQLV